MREITALLDEAAVEGLRENGALCTVAVLAFQGIPGGETGSFRGLSRGTSSFLGAPRG